MFHDVVVGPNSSKTHLLTGCMILDLKNIYVWLKKNHNYSGFRPYVDIGRGLDPLRVWQVSSRPRAY